MTTLEQLRSVGLWYVSSPYSKYPGGIWPAYKEAARVTGRLFAAGLDVYSPIAHTHPLAIYGELDPLDAAMWYARNETMMARCDGCLVIRMRGWENSDGVKAEIAKFICRPIHHIDPQTLAIVGQAGMGSAA